MKRFTLTITYDVQLDDEVINQVDDDWCSVYYDLGTDEEIAQHVGRCVARGVRLSRMDGWVDLPDVDRLVVVTEVGADLVVASREELEAAAEGCEQRVDEWMSCASKLYTALSARFYGGGG